MNKVVTRFAPSPTGALHIGGARTALFNYLFARHYNGEFLLRIEDTDFSRSTEEHKDNIIRGLKWLSINWDRDIIFQSQNQNRHVAAALQLVEQGKAYYCFSTTEEISIQRQIAIEQKSSFIFRSPWRNSNIIPNTSANHSPYVIRFKAPDTGTTVIEDSVQGTVNFQNQQIDDMILLRSDGTPTYMLAVVVDDHDMGITHIIRGDDHLTNAAKQIALYKAFGWKVPIMAHIPLIHSSNGTKLSKRRGALNIELYKEMGFLPEALGNYILRLGWAYQDEEIISRNRAIKLFSLSGLGQSPARLDEKKMLNINGHYIRNMDNASLTKIVIQLLSEQHVLSQESHNLITAGMNMLKVRAHLITELVQNAKVFITDINLNFTDKAMEIIYNTPPTLIDTVVATILGITELTSLNVKQELVNLATAQCMQLKELMEPIRALLTGNTKSPSIFDIIPILGKENTIKRLNYYRQIRSLNL